MDDFRAVATRFSKSARNLMKSSWVLLWNNGGARFAAWFSLALGFLTILFNTLLVHHINHRVFPDSTQHLAEIMERDVSLGRVKWALPTGLVGLTPVMAIGPVAIGAGSVEKSEMRIDEMRVGLDCWRSVMRGEVVLNLHCNEAEAKLVQADNYSWFGRPVDTSPPSSDFVPGLHKEEPEQQESASVEAGTFMGMKVEEALVRRVAELTQTLSGRRARERRLSQYTCSTSNSTSPSQGLSVASRAASEAVGVILDKGRHVMASLSTDVSNDNRPVRNLASIASPTPPPSRPIPKPLIKLSSIESGVPRRLKLDKTARETSHGVVMKHDVKARPKKEIRPRKRLTELQRKKKDDTEIHPVKQEEPIPAAILPSLPTEAASVPSDLAPEATAESTPPAETEPAENEGISEAKAEDSSMSDTTRSSSDSEVSVEEVKGWIAALWHQMSRHVKPPSVAVGYMSFVNSTILAYTTSENLPREFVDARATVRLGKGYHALQVDLQANAHKRNPRSTKWTRISPHAPKHLRFVTPGAQRPFDRVFPEDVTTDTLMRSDTSAALTEPETDTAGTAGALSSLTASGMQMLAPVSEDGLFDVRHSPTKSFPPPSRTIRQDTPQDRTRTEGRPKGGSLRITVKGKDLFLKDQIGDLSVAITGKHLHAPLLERVLEVPIDIQEGRADGTVFVTANTQRTWQMPRLDGQVQVKGVDMHFWDAPDHVSKANFGLLLENNRMYFHNAAGYFGALPLVLSGDMDVDPEFGEYRLTAVLSPVELNVARATFGIRPTPNPIAGALHGLVHCTGSLREPVFSGVIHCSRPTDEMMQSMGESHAKTALNALPDAVGAFDKVPFVAGRVLFTHDMGTDVFTVHDLAAQPAGGGRVRGSGQIWVAPSAEQDPHALHLRGEAQGVAAHKLLQRYVPENVELPKVLDCGATNVRLSMKGSHAAPVTEIKWDSPSVQVTGEATLSRTAWKATATAPSFDISGTLHTEFPDFESTKQIFTQDEMTRVCQPKIQEVDSDIVLKGCDLLPLFSKSYTSSRVKSGQAVRLKVSGGTHIKAKHLPSVDSEDTDPQRFQGEVTLQGLRMNQLNLAKQLVGQLEVSSSGVSLTAKGQRDDEMMDFSIALPEAADWLSQDTSAEEAVKRGSSSEQDAAQALLKGARFSLKQDKLEISSQVDSVTNRVQMHVRGLTLDELELASLRGSLQDLSLDLNFLKREGRGELQMTSPRYSGLMGKALSGGFRWERDVVRLERMVLEQQASRYELQGEYALPSNIQQPDLQLLSYTEGSPNWLPGEVLAATTQPTIGRWRIQVNVPTADVQEILPGMRLLSQATSVREIDYEKAREEFLRGLEEGELTSPPLSDFLTGSHRKKEADSGNEASEAKVTATTALPGIQSLKGTWSGTLQAFGGGGGASIINFNLRGQSWKWGDYEVDEAVTVGSYHSSEGAHLEEISMQTGEAQFSLRGDLLGPKQNASFLLNDFPAALLSPIYLAVPALQNAVPAVTDHTQGIKRLMDGWERTKTTLGLSDVKEDTPMEKLTKGSPVNGLLFVRGAIGGSADAPEGSLGLELYDGMIGTTQLNTASAQVALGPDRNVDFKLDCSPLESKGYLRIEGTAQLPQTGRVGEADVKLSIRDGGMAIVAAMVPEFKWTTGNASIDFGLHGSIADPEVQGKARISRATLSVPNLRFPLKHTTGTVRVEDGKLMVDQFEAKSGNHGHIKARGVLPVLKKYMDEGETDDALSVLVSKLELKMNSVYNGRLDSHLQFKRCLKEPVVSGDIEISKGNVVLQLGAFATPPPVSETSSTMSAHRPSAMQFPDIQLPKVDSQGELTPPVISIPKQVPMDGVCLENLKLKLGSELRFQVPFMVNLLLSGGIEVSGPPQDLTPVGEIYIDGGMVNLFATQLTVDREDSPGTIRFVPEQGFDPDLDFTFTSRAEGFKAICNGRGSNWQENVVLRFQGVDGTDEENLSQAAKIFQTKLAAALVAENGQLALGNLAASTMATMSPRLDTWGKIGAARWRIVSAPNIPYLLNVSERLDFQDIVTSLLSGTEIEVQYGPTQAVIAHKAHGSTFGMQWNLALNLTDNLKLTAGVVNTPSTTSSILFQYSSESRTKMK